MRRRRRMKIELNLNKKDWLTIVVLSIVFFSLAVWNLGLARTPITTWQTSQNKTFYIDLGDSVNVGTVYFLVKSGAANVQFATGSLGSWSKSITVNIPFKYYSWSEINVDNLTRYVQFEVQPESSIEIAEVAVLSSGGQRIVIAAVNDEDAFDSSLSHLVDEQNLVELPPTYMGETYFDEIYYVRSAEQYLNLQVPYEWTHPPLGKLIIASGISVFGFNPFGWRIMGVIFATLMIPLIYILGKKLLGTWIGGLASAFLLVFDFMHFTMARISTVDTYVVFFSLASQLFFLIYLKNVLKDGWKTSILPLFLAILFFALGFSTKWFVLYGFAGQLVVLAALRLKEVSKLKKGLADKIYAFTDHPFAMVLGFLLLSVLVYFLTYIPDILAGRSLIDVIELQGSMYNYHATLTATHPFSSPWWTWPLMLKPLWLYVAPMPNNVTSTITLMGNPLVWWVGFASIVVISVFALIKVVSLAGKQLIQNAGLPSVFIVTFFFFQWVPYMLISRVTFIYHFYLNVPFLSLATAYIISRYWSSRWTKLAVLAYFAGVMALFALFYPAISGVPTSNSFIDSLKWFNGWIF
jgi:dolichyl-phosphate-mannose-protein mannosyltransferase